MNQSITIDDMLTRWDVIHCDPEWITKIPISKENKLLRIFGILPTWITVEGIIKNTHLTNIDNFSYIDLIVQDSGAKIKLIVKNSDWEGIYDFKIWENSSLLIDQISGTIQGIMR